MAAAAVAWTRHVLGDTAGAIKVLRRTEVLALWRRTCDQSGSSFGSKTTCIEP